MPSTAGESSLRVAGIDFPDEQIAASLRAGLDPDGVMRRCAERTDAFTVNFPGMGPVHFVATAEGAREILTLPRDVLCAPTPNPIEPIVGPSSVILTSGAQHRRQRRDLSPAFRGAQIRDRARTMVDAVTTDSRRYGASSVSFS